MRVHANRDSALVLAAQASKAVPKITTIPELKGIHMEADARLAMLTMTATNHLRIFDASGHRGDGQLVRRLAGRC